ncbi:hypothetical protein ACOQFL_14800 [Actinopolyspora sp. H202]|uniref:hypothetical protein n=1 Tax=Actinopolyspora sp. H202 TaxID=1500456 RepID=UPI003EE51DAD
MVESTEFDETPVSERRREEVRIVADQLGFERTSVIRFHVRSLEYAVPERRKNGKPHGSSRTMRILRGTMWISLMILSLPIAAVLGGLDEIFNDAGPSGRGPLGKLTVHGKRSCAALSFADAAKESEREMWLAWSRSLVALLGTSGEQPPELLWISEAQRPELEFAKEKLRWPDKSRVEFVLAQAELDRVRQQQGTP